jgi:transcriptional regulator with XRE-family HTH domain
VAQIGRRVAVIREELELTQKQVAERAGIARNTLYRVEAGRLPNPGAQVIEGVARGLGVPPGELFKDPAESFTTRAGVTISPKGTAVLIGAASGAASGAHATLSVSDELAHLRGISADWERGRLSDRELVEGVGQVYERLRDRVA